MAYYKHGAEHQISIPVRESNSVLNSPSVDTDLYQAIKKKGVSFQ
jgi:hypothetical protein